MHPKNIKEGKFDICDDKHLDSIVIQLDDNGEEEFQRVGICTDKQGIFLVDLNDTGFRYREKNYVRKDLDVKKILAIGVDLNVFEVGGYHGHKYRIDSGAGDWNAFLAAIL